MNRLEVNTKQAQICLKNLIFRNRTNEYKNRTNEYKNRRNKYKNS